MLGSLRTFLHELFTTKATLLDWLGVLLFLTIPLGLLLFLGTAVWEFVLSPIFGG